MPAGSDSHKVDRAEPAGPAGPEEGMAAPSPPEGMAAPVRRLRRAERREQILAAATRAFARSGFAATGLEDVAAEAGISRAILYRHFDSKTDLYRAVLERARARLVAGAGTRGDFSFANMEAMLRVAAEDPAGFQLLFRHAAREPEFRREMDRFRTAIVRSAYRQLAEVVPDEDWARWAAQLAPTVAIEATMAWLDAGRPDPGQVAGRVRRVITGVVEAARQPPRPESTEADRPDRA